MKTVFIVNPKAGHNNNIQAFTEHLKKISARLNADTEIYQTIAVGDGQRFVQSYCEKFGAARFIACAGDGTLSEVLNGAIASKDSEIGVIPIGTGNDFCRNFGDENFQDIALQLTGESVKCDAIRYTTTINGTEKTGYGINMFNIGFDCNVADKTADIKNNTFASGSLAYFLSILINLIKKKGADLKIDLDGTEALNGALLLTSIANGSFCGGGIKSNPLASIRDGLININIIKNISRLRFITLLPCYMKGSFLKKKNIERVITTKKCKKVTITPNTKTIRLCTDGEICDVGKIEFEIVHNAFNFILPSLRAKNSSEKVPAEAMLK